MTEHDPHCYGARGSQLCICDELAAARADEREKSARAIMALPMAYASPHPEISRAELDFIIKAAYERAADAARSGRWA